MDALKAVELVESGSPLAQLVGHGFAKSSNVYIVGGLAVKEYLHFKQKSKPIVRAKNEFELLTYTQDISGVAHNAQLFIRGERIFLTREAGLKPARWEMSHLLQIQETLVALVGKSVCLNDPVQSLVREDGSAFIYDFDNGSCGNINKTDSDTTGYRFPIQETDLWQDANINYQRFLREEGMEERLLDMIRYISWEINRINQFTDEQSVFDKFYSSRVEALKQRLNREIEKFVSVLSCFQISYPKWK